jgi:hypothetical protein
MYDSALPRAADYVSEMRIPGSWRFRNSTSGQDTVYASCFAAMIWHYAGQLCKRTTPAERQDWAEYLQSFQDRQSGYFLVPEIAHNQLTSDAHDLEHLRMHFCAHVLPALSLLGAPARYPLQFAHRFLDPRVLDAWLAARDWRRAWIEGNNLLFVGQFLLHLGESEGRAEAPAAVRRLLDWLDDMIDPASGLWGTNGYCDLHAALYGGYHQLLLYYYLRRPLVHAARLVDSVLGLQHFDGGFHRFRGGGTCQDVDAVDVLVNLYKRAEWRRRDIRRALRRADLAVRARQCANGGFVDRPGQEFSHMGIAATHAPAGEPNMFSTWFGIHTLLLIREVLGPRGMAGISGDGTGFNTVCSMGWHDTTLAAERGGSVVEAPLDYIDAAIRRAVTRVYARVSASREALARRRHFC